MKKHINILIILLCFFCTIPVLAQKRDKKDRTRNDEPFMVQKETQKPNKKLIKILISGQVFKDNGIPAMNVLVTANEGADETTTDNEGKFSIDVTKGSHLLFELVGYKTVSINESNLASNLFKVNLVALGNAYIDGVVDLPYQTITRSRTTGLVSVVNPEKELERDTRYFLGSATNGKISGLIGANNIHGLGNAVYIVDGIKRDESYLNMLEVESITVLKDVVSRMLYGAQGDQGVILVKTKSGVANKKITKVTAESGIMQALQYPEFLNAAQYMTAYNKAQQNDASFAGTALATPKYSQTLIDNTLNGVDPVLYPDNNYFGNDYVKDFTNYSNVYTELSGGSNSTQYFLNLGLSHNAGWIKAGDNDTRNEMNIHGKVNFKVTSWLKMHSEVVCVFDIKNSPNVNTYKTDGSLDLDFWGKASTYLPNTQTLLIPVSRITNPTIIPASSIIDGAYVLGGSSVYQTSLLGDMTRTGKDVNMNRFIQFNNGFNLNLNGITKGLTAKGLLSLNFNNTYDKKVLDKYSVYQMGVVDTLGNFPVTQFGVDNKTTEQTNTQTYFDRTISGYFSLNYDRTFGEHAFTAVLVGAFNQFRQNAIFQENKNVKIGLQANYTYKDRFIVDAGVLAQGSSKLPTNNKFGVSPTIGLGWIMSKENFMKSIKAIDYLKIRSSYGVIQNDNWIVGNYKGYYLYETNYALNVNNAGNYLNFTYGNGTAGNTPLMINSFASNIGWQTRNEFVGGFDLSLFNNKTWLEASYFNSVSADNITQMTNNSPSTLGSVPVFENYNSTVYQGVEIGVKHTEKTGKLSLTIGANYLYSSNKITKIDEPKYILPTNINLEQVGTSTNALWGLTSAGLYMPTDFDALGKLLSGNPTPTFGNVKPGDIKYVDYNGDGKIDANDYHVLGNSLNNQQFSFDLDVNYGNWQLYALAVGLTGGKGFKNSDYYWFKGTSAKYSSVALGAFDPLNPDPNATYPRLSLSNGSNNYLKSTFWLYDKTNVSLSIVQLGYNFKFKQSSVLSVLKVYARANNLLTFAKDEKTLNLNYKSTPASRTFSFGLIASF